MHANEAKKLVEQAKKSNAEKWWDGIKEKIFKAIEHQAIAEQTILRIDYHHDLNKGMPWLSSPNLAWKAKDELEKLGYKAGWDSGEDEFTITW